MIPILYKPGTESFDGRGVGRLSDVISCRVTEQLNAEYEMTMTYPMRGAFFDEIALNSIIAVEPAQGKEAQAFIVYDISKPLNGIVTIYCEHISYRLSFIPVSPFTSPNLKETLQLLKSYAVEDCPFDFWTDKDVESTYTQELPSSIKSRLQGEEGSVLQTYKGQFEFDNYTVKLWNQRGEDNGVTLRYGKNLTSLTQEENIRDTITGVYPFWQGMDEENEAYVELPEKVLHSDKAANFPFQRTVPLDLSAEWIEEKPTIAQLRDRAQRYMTDNNIGVPDVSLEVSFVNLSETEDYKEIAPLEAVNMGDVIKVQFPSLGVDSKAQVVKTVYDPLLGRYQSVSIGKVRANLSQVLVNQGQEIQQKASNAAASLMGFNEALNQRAIFNRLTDNGKLQGIYMEEGKLYVNGSYIKAGVIDADVVSIINLIAQVVRSLSTDESLMTQVVGGSMIMGTKNASGSGYTNRITTGVEKSGSYIYPKMLMRGSSHRVGYTYAQYKSGYDGTIPDEFYGALYNDALFVGCEEQNFGGNTAEAYGDISAGNVFTKELIFNEQKNGLGHMGIMKKTTDGISVYLKDVDWITVQGTDGKNHYVLGTP